MKKIYSLSFVAAVVASLLFTGCTKDSSTAATADTSAQVSFGVQSDNPLVTLASVNPGGSLVTQAVSTTASVTWTTATANITKFKLNAKKAGVAFEVVSNGLLNIDMFAAIPSTICAVIANGTYTNVELHVVLAKSTTTTLPLVLKGNYTTKAGNVIPIEFDFNEDTEIVALTNDLTIDGKNDVLAKVSLHLNKLLSNITAQEIDQTVRTNSMILITSAINPTVYAKIKADLLLSGGSNVTTTPKK
ncbi:MAG: hypothetical protein V4553_18005 [Bacteroidota bacterium]